LAPSASFSPHFRGYNHQKQSRLAAQVKVSAVIGDQVQHGQLSVASFVHVQGPKPTQNSLCSLIPRLPQQEISKFQPKSCKYHAIWCLTHLILQLHRTFSIQEWTLSIKIALQRTSDDGALCSHCPISSLLVPSRHNSSQHHPSHNCSAVRNSMPNHSPHQTPAKCRIRRC